jgi:hypothetical protein
MPMKFEKLLRVAAIKEHRAIASDHTLLLSPP